MLSVLRLGVEGSWLLFWLFLRLLRIEMEELNLVELLGLALPVSALLCFLRIFVDDLMRLCYSGCSFMHYSRTIEDY